MRRSIRANRSHLKTFSVDPCNLAMSLPTWPELLLIFCSLLGNFSAGIFFLREHWAADYCFRWCLEDLAGDNRAYPEGAAEFCVERYGTCPNLIGGSCFVFPSYMASITADISRGYPSGYCG